MAADPTISVVICTQNRAAALRETLASLAKVRMQHAWKAELLVVDNASTDNTAAVVREAKLPNLEVTYYFEPRKGKSNALNAALARTRGELILFTDDDVTISESWIEEMILAFAQQGCDAAVGKITLASHLVRPWMNRRHYWWLACPDEQPVATPELIGANMAVRHAVLERVPGYDPELGPGALGLGEEALFGGQLRAAGFKIGYAERASVVHAPDASRLKRRDWLDLARKHGRQEAYIEYHWNHVTPRAPRLRWLFKSLKLGVRRLVQRPPALAAEGCPDWEMCYVREVEKLRHFCVERRRPRNYALRGLVKLKGQLTGEASLIAGAILKTGEPAR
jgi:glycosyltransferase involved in cell wall biosynthesis